MATREIRFRLWIGGYSLHENIMHAEVGSTIVPPLRFGTSGGQIHTVYVDDEGFAEHFPTGQTFSHWVSASTFSDAQIDTSTWVVPEGTKIIPVHMELKPLDVLFNQVPLTSYFKDIANREVDSNGDLVPPIQEEIIDLERGYTFWGWHGSHTNRLLKAQPLTTYLDFRDYKFLTQKYRTYIYMSVAEDVPWADFYVEGSFVGFRNRNPHTLKVTPPLTPSKANHGFVGWTLFPNGSKEIFNLDANLTESVELHAVFKGYKTVSFNTQGGSAVSSQTILEGETATQPADPTRNGYVFKGWYTESSGGSVFDFSTPLTDDTTVFAQWEQILTVTFISEGNTFDSKTVSEGETVSAPSPAPVREGYNFTGWFTSSSGGSQFNFSTPITSNTILYAQWAIKVYDVVFYEFTPPNSYVVYQTIQVNHGGNVTPPPPPEPPDVSQEFDKWVFHNTTTEAVFTNITSHTFVVATYKIRTFTLRFRAHSSWNYYITVDYGFKFGEQEPTTNPTLANNTFEGWNYDSLVYDPNVGVTQNYSIWAVFKAIFNLSFNTNGGTSLSSIQAFYPEYEIETSEFGTTTRNNYNFLGWYHDTALTDPVVGSTITLASNKTIHAKWEFTGQLENENNFVYDGSGIIADGNNRDVGFLKRMVDHEHEYELSLTGKLRLNEEFFPNAPWQTGYYEVYGAMFDGATYVNTQRLGSLANYDGGYTQVDENFQQVTTQLSFSVPEGVNEIGIYLVWNEVLPSEDNLLTYGLNIEFETFETAFQTREIEIFNEDGDYIIDRAFAEFGSFTIQVPIFNGAKENFKPAPATEFLDAHSCNKMFTDSNQIILYGSLYKTGNWFKTVIKQYDYISLRNNLNFQTSKKERIVACLALEGNIIVFADNEDLGGSIHRVYGNGDDYDAGDGYFSPYRRKLVNSTMSCDHKGSLQFTENFLVFKYRNDFYMIDSRDLNADRLEVTMVSDKIQRGGGRNSFPETNGLDDFSLFSEITENYYGVIFPKTGERWKLYYNMPFRYEGKDKIIYPWLRDESPALKIDSIISLDRVPTHINKNMLIQYTDETYNDLGQKFDTVIITKAYSMTEINKIVKFVNSVILKFYRSSEDRLDMDVLVYNEANRLLIGESEEAYFDEKIGEIVWGKKEKDYEAPMFVVESSDLQSKIGRDLFNTKVYNVDMKFPCLSAYVFIRFGSNEAFKLSSLTFNYTSTDMPAYDLGKLYSEIIGGKK